MSSISLKRVVSLRNIKRQAQPGDKVITLENVEGWTGRLHGYTDPADVSGELVSYEKGDVLFNKLRPYLAKVHLASHNGLATGEMLVLKPDAKKLSPKYLFYRMISKESILEVNNATYGVKMPRANWDIVGSLDVTTLPDIEDQKRLVNYLDTKTRTLDKVLTAKNHIYIHLSELRQAIITELVYPDGGRVMSGSDQLYRHLLSQESGTWGEDPNGINEVKCLRVADFDYGHLSHIEPSTVRSIAPTHIRTKMLQTGDILIEKSGGGEKTPVGRAILIGKIDEPATYANFIDRLRFKNTVLPEYALYLLYAMYAGGVNTKYIKQNTGIQNLDIKHYLMEPVSIPDIDKQREIVSKIKSKLQKIDKADATLQKSISQLEEYRSSLISNVVGGKVEV